jgi:hypothetical protein
MTVTKKVQVYPGQFDLRRFRKSARGEKAGIVTGLLPLQPISPGQDAIPERAVTINRFGDGLQILDADRRKARLATAPFKSIPYHRTVSCADSV